MDSFEMESRCMESDCVESLRSESCTATSNSCAVPMARVKSGNRKTDKNIADREKYFMRCFNFF